MLLRLFHVFAIGMSLPINKSLLRLNSAAPNQQHQASTATAVCALADDLKHEMNTLRIQMVASGGANKFSQMQAIATRKDGILSGPGSHIGEPEKNTADTPSSLLQLAFGVAPMLGLYQPRQSSCAALVAAGAASIADAAIPYARQPTVDGANAAALPQAVRRATAALSRQLIYFGAAGIMLPEAHCALPSDGIPAGNARPAFSQDACQHDDSSATAGSAAIRSLTRDTAVPDRRTTVAFPPACAGFNVAHGDLPLREE